MPPNRDDDVVHLQYRCLTVARYIAMNHKNGPLAGRRAGGGVAIGRQTAMVWKSSEALASGKDLPNMPCTEA